MLPSYDIIINALNNISVILRSCNNNDLRECTIITSLKQYTGYFISLQQNIDNHSEYCQQQSIIDKITVVHN